jgi:hypothetical protein
MNYIPTVHTQKPHGKSEDNIKMYSRETKCESVNCIRLNRGTVRQRAFVISEMKVSLPLLDSLNEIRSIKLIDQLAYFTTHYNMVIGKSKVTLEQAVKAQRGRGGVVL